MADLPVGNEGSLNSTTAQTALAAPASSTQRVIPRKGVSVYNIDTIVHNIVMQKNKAATITIIQRFGNVPVDGTVVLDKVVILDATDESFEIVMEEVLATTQPEFDVSAMETT